MSLRFARLALAALALVFTACEWGPDTSPSTGLCQGALGSRPLDGMIDPDASEYHLVDKRFVVNLSYLRGAFRTTGTSVGLFTPDRSVYDFGTGCWSVIEPVATNLAAGTATVDASTPYRMTGSVDLETADGATLRCTFNLRRATEQEGDEVP